MPGVAGSTLSSVHEVSKRSCGSISSEIRFKRRGGVGCVIMLAWLVGVTGLVGGLGTVVVGEPEITVRPWLGVSVRPVRVTVEDPPETRFDCL